MRSRPAPTRLRRISPHSDPTITPQPVRLDDVESKLRGIFQSRRDTTLFISGAPTLRYGKS